MTNLSTLIERVRGLTGPDREVDVEIYLALTKSEAIANYEVWAHHAPSYTASLDTVVSLIERELPHGYDLWAREGSSVAMIYWSEDDGCKATAKTPALALLLAALTAIKERDE